MTRTLRCSHGSSRLSVSNSAAASSPLNRSVLKATPAPSPN
jgi:hypothetical protein